MRNEDNAHYYHFTGPMRLEKAMHSLEGIVLGTAMDGKVSDDEIGAIVDWIKEHEEFIHRHPFNEVIPRLNEIVSDGIVDEEERSDILWLCNQFSTKNQRFSAITSDMQRLQGILAGIIADGKITKEELEGLREWMTEREHLRKTWPFDEIEAVITAVLRDGIVDEQEHQFLLAFFDEFALKQNHRVLTRNEDFSENMIMGVCAVCPEIEFPERNFCFTGKSVRTTRAELTSKIEELGGIPLKSVTKDLHYLIIGSDGNPCWAFSCYGRKVEKAVEYRKRGLPILLVHENDFWDSVEDSSL